MTLFLDRSGRVVRCGQLTKKGEPCRRNATRQDDTLSLHCRLHPGTYNQSHHDPECGMSLLPMFGSQRCTCGKKARLARCGVCKTKIHPDQDFCPNFLNHPETWGNKRPPELV